MGFFSHDFNRIDYRKEMKVCSKGKKVTHVNIGERLKEFFPLRNEFITFWETESH